MEFMINRDNVFAEKSQIKNYIDSDKLFLFGDDIYLKNLKGNKIGFNLENNFIIRNYKETPNGVDFILNNQNYSFKLNGRHNCINASMGVAIGLSLGLTPSEIQKGLDLVNVTPMRFQKIEKNGTLYINDAYNASPVSMKASLETFDSIDFSGLDLVNVTPMRFQKIEKNGTLYINDAYNASPVSMKASLETFDSIDFSKKKLAILADMGEMGNDEIRFHEEVLEYALKTKIDTFILMGSRMKEAMKKFNDGRLTYCNTKDEIKKLISTSYKDNVILLKGSNFNHLWEII